MAQRDEFDVAGSFVPLKTLVGELLYFTPTEYVEKDPSDPTSGIKTDFGYKDAVITDITVLTNPGGPVTHHDQMVLQGKMIGQLKRRITTGRSLLGRLVLGEKKPNQNAPYEIVAPSEDDMQMARDFLAGRTVSAAAAPAAEAEDPFAV